MPLLIVLVFGYPAIAPVFAISSLLYEVADPPYVDMEYVAGRWIFDALYVLALGIVIGVAYFGYPASNSEKIIAVILGCTLGLLAAKDAMWQLLFVGGQRDALDRWKAVAYFAIYLAAIGMYAFLFFDRLGIILQIFSS